MIEKSNEPQNNNVSVPVQSPMQEQLPPKKRSIKKIIGIVVLLTLMPLIYVLFNRGDEYIKANPEATSTTKPVSEVTKPAKTDSVFSSQLTEFEEESNQDDEKMPATTSEFTYRRCGNTDLQLLTPDTWFFKEEVVGDTEACFITKEEITSPTTMFTTGISVNRITGINEKKSVTASEFAKSFIENVASADGISSASEITEEIGEISTYSRFADATDFKMYFLVLADDTSDLVYVITFESPDSNWESEFGIAENVLSNIVVSEEDL